MTDYLAREVIAEEIMIDSCTGDQVDRLASSLSCRRDSTICFPCIISLCVTYNAVDDERVVSNHRVAKHNALPDSMITYY